MKIISYGLFLGLAVQISGGTAYGASKKPENWPWKGVVVHSCCGGFERADVSRLADMGVNAIVLNINARLDVKKNKIDPEVAWERSLHWATDMLDACGAKGLTAILRLTAIPIDPATGINERSPDFWRKEGAWKEAVQRAETLAKRFKGRGAELAAYAFLTEPVLTLGGIAQKPPNWDDIQLSIINAVRKYDGDRYIVVAAAPGGLPKAYGSFRPINKPNLIYSAHVYLPYTYTHQGLKGRPKGVSYPGQIGGKKWTRETLKLALSPLRRFQIDHNALVWVGEFGVVDNAKGYAQYLTDLVYIFNEYDWSWSYFLYKGNPLWDLRYRDKNVYLHLFAVGEDATKHLVAPRKVYLSK